MPWIFKPSMAEAVGIILGVLPLIITAVDKYGQHRLNKSTLKRLRLKLLIEQCLYRDSLKRLLQKELSKSELEKLFPDSPSPEDAKTLWGMPQIEEKLRSVLRGEYGLFIEMNEVMKDIIKNLMDTLDMHDQQPGGSRSRDWKKLWRGFQRKEMEVMIEDLLKYNLRISQWVQNKEKLAPQSPPPPKDGAEDGITYLERVRHEACQLYHILEHAWRCSCIDAHEVHLQLEQRNDDEKPFFQIYFSLRSPNQQHGRIWRQTHIRLEEVEEAHHPIPGSYRFVRAYNAPEQSNKLQNIPLQLPTANPHATASMTYWTQTNRSTTQPTDSPKSERCLCEALQHAPTCGKSGTVCVLPHALGKSYASISCITTTSPGLPPLVDLESLLSSATRNGFHSKMKGLYWRERLGIAVILSSTILQLYESPWLNESWGKKDIYVLQSTADEDTSFPNIHLLRSFLSPEFKAESSQSTRPTVTQSCFRSILNKTLFSLGIILIELCLNRSFEELRSSVGAKATHKHQNISDDIEVANRLVEEVYSQAGDEYGYVVQRCLRCEFGVPDSQKHMDSPVFRRLIYQNVVKPLKNDYKVAFL